MQSRHDRPAELLDNWVDLTEYPTLEKPSMDDYVLILGDLHANALKFVYYLIRHRRLDISPEQYALLVTSYKIVEYYCDIVASQISIERLNQELGDLTPEDSAEKRQQLQATLDAMIDEKAKAESRYLLYMREPFEIVNKEKIRFHVERFNTIVERAPVLSRGPIIILGDDVCDRGAGEQFILPTYRKLTLSHIPYAIVFSNHLLSFLRHLENANDFGQSTGYIPDQVSYYNMTLLNTSGIIDANELKSLYYQYYAPNVKLIAYVIDKPLHGKARITRFTHAKGVGLTTDKHYAKELDVFYCDRTVESFAYTRDRMNKAFQEKIFRTNNVVELSHLNEVDNLVIISPPYEYSLLRYAWSREAYETHNAITYETEKGELHEENDVMPAELNDFLIDYAHGHSMRLPTEATDFEHIFSLDNRLGFGLNQDEGEDKTLLVPGRITLSPEEILQAEKILMEEIHARPLTSSRDEDSSTVEESVPPLRPPQADDRGKKRTTSDNVDEESKRLKP